MAGSSALFPPFIGPIFGCTFAFGSANASGRKIELRGENRNTVKNEITINDKKVKRKLPSLLNKE
jgi:hypothetical protein